MRLYAPGAACLSGRQRLAVLCRRGGSRSVTGKKQRLLSPQYPLQLRPGRPFPAGRPCGLRLCPHGKGDSAPFGPFAGNRAGQRSFPRRPDSCPAAPVCGIQTSSRQPACFPFRPAGGEQSTPDAALSCPSGPAGLYPPPCPSGLFYKKHNFPPQICKNSHERNGRKKKINTEKTREIKFM